jgi:hypothetical protein
VEQTSFSSGTKYFTSGDERVEVKISHAKQAKADFLIFSYQDCPAYFKIAASSTGFQDEIRSKTQIQSILD